MHFLCLHKNESEVVLLFKVERVSASVSLVFKLLIGFFMSPISRLRHTACLIFIQGFFILLYNLSKGVWKICILPLCLCWNNSSEGDGLGKNNSLLFSIPPLWDFDDYQQFGKGNFFIIDWVVHRFVLLYVIIFVWTISNLRTKCHKA